MCRATYEGGRRCKGGTRWCVNREGHKRFAPDTAQERHWVKPTPLLSMTPTAIRVRRMRANRYAAEVDSMRTVHGVPASAPIGPVLREALWAHRYQGAGLSLHAQAAIFKAVATEEGVDTKVVADRFAAQHVTPHRQSAGERLADLVVDPTRADWIDEAHLVRSIEPAENGTPNPVYLALVRDLDGTEFALLRSYDGSEPMAYPADAAGLKAAGWDAIQRARAVDADPTAYERWLRTTDSGDATGAALWTQAMTDGDFLANHEAMHLV